MNLFNKIRIILVAFLALHLIKIHAQKRPNIVFILTDDQSCIDPKNKDPNITYLDGEKTQSHPFGFNGDKEVYTPIIDGLAADGMIFNSAYVSSSVCSPSRYSILSGRYAGRSEGASFMRSHPYGTMTRVENNTELEIKRENLAKLLQKAGYTTGFVGKSHVMDHHLLNLRNAEKIEKAGLKPFAKDADPNDPTINKKMQHNHDFWSKKIKEYGFDYTNGVYAANLKELWNDALNVHNVEWKNKAALEFIDKAGKEPFFLYYSETVPHGPAPWVKKKGKYVYGLDADAKYTSKGVVTEPFKNMPERDAILKEVIAQGKDPDHAWLRWFDYAVGALVKKLKEKGVYENTLIVLTSDHGNYNLGKTTIYEGGIKVPLMMHWPKGIKPNSTYDEMVQNIDFTPTFLDLAGVNLSKVDPLDGVSLANVLGGDKQAVHEYLFFEMGYARGVRTKDWKYIAVRYPEKDIKKIKKGIPYKGYKGHVHKYPYYTRNGHLGYHASKLNPLYFDADQLFDMNNDEEEKKNIYKQNPKKVKELKQLLVKSLKTFPSRPYGEFVK